MFCTAFQFSERWEATKNLVGGGGGGVKISSKPYGMCIAMHYTVMVGIEIAGPFSPGGMVQLLDNVQNKSWIKALQESGCSSNEDGLISVHSAFPAAT